MIKFPISPEECQDLIDEIYYDLVSGIFDENFARKVAEHIELQRYAFSKWPDKFPNPDLREHPSNYLA